MQRQWAYILVLVEHHITTITLTITIILLGMRITTLIIMGSHTKDFIPLVMRDANINAQDAIVVLGLVVKNFLKEKENEEIIS